jgi:hypothetical protein
MREASAKAHHRNNTTLALWDPWGALQEVNRVVHPEALDMAFTIPGQSAPVGRHNYQHCLSKPRIHPRLNYNRNIFQPHILNHHQLPILAIFLLSNLCLVSALINSLKEMVQLFLWWCTNAYRPWIFLDWTRKAYIDYQEQLLILPGLRPCLTMVSSTIDTAPAKSNKG